MALRAASRCRLQPAALDAVTTERGTGLPTWRANRAEISHKRVRKVSSAAILSDAVFDEQPKQQLNKLFFDRPLMDVQTRGAFREDDIERRADDYGRAG